MSDLYIVIVGKRRCVQKTYLHLDIRSTTHYMEVRTPYKRKTKWRYVQKGSTKMYLHLAIPSTTHYMEVRPPYKRKTKWRYVQKWSTKMYLHLAVPSTTRYMEVWPPYKKKTKWRCDLHLDTAFFYIYFYFSEKDIV